MASKKPIFDPQPALVANLKSHPRNYRQHPEDQIDHLVQSIKEHGFYKNITVAKENTILAGHGMVQAAIKMGLASVPMIKLPIAPDSPQALKILAGDNEIGRLGIIDDSGLTDILKDIKDMDPEGLLGTGFDMEAVDRMLNPPSSKPPEEFSNPEKDMKIEFRCPKCAYEWSGNPLPTK